MQREISQPTSQTPLEPLMLNIPHNDSFRFEQSKPDTDEDHRTWSDRMREIERLEDPERWDGMG